MFFQIDAKYHCAVCNETFEINNDKEHFYGENHKDNMFYALNQDLHVNVDVDVNGKRGMDDSNDDRENCKGLYDYDFNITVIATNLINRYFLCFCGK